jgi:hypothetical protein
MRKKGEVGGSKIIGGLYLNLHDGMKNHYLNCPWNTSLSKWYKKWFYIQEEPNIATFCNVSCVLEKRVSWMDRLEYTGQIEELMNLIKWSRLDGPGVVGNFLSRQVQPCQRRVHPGYVYQGSQATTRMHRDKLDKTEIHCRISELFNLADSNFVRSDNQMHAYKLAQPASKVRNKFAQSCNFIRCRP